MAAMAQHGDPAARATKLFRLQGNVLAEADLALDYLARADQIERCITFSAGGDGQRLTSRGIGGQAQFRSVCVPGADADNDDTNSKTCFPAHCLFSAVQAVLIYGDAIAVNT